MNKKKSLIIGGVAAVVLVIILCFVCCRRSKDQYCAVIPKTASAVIRVDAASFIEKHDISLESLKSMMGNMDKLYNNPGVDVNRPLYFFVTEKGATGVTMAVKDAEDLKSLVNTYGGLMQAKLTEKQGYNWIELGDMLFAFDDNRLVGLQGGGMNARKDIRALMEQDEDESFLSTSLYGNIAKLEQPIVIGASSKSMPLELKEVLKGQGISEEKIDMDVIVSLDVIKDKAVMTFDVLPNSVEAKNYIAEYETKMKKIDGSYISSIVDKPLVWGAFNINSSLICESLKNVPGMDEALKGLDLAKVLGSFDGDFTFVLPRNDTEEFICQAKVKNNDVLSVVDSINSLSEGAIQTMKVGENAYCISNGKSPVFLGVKEGTFYVSNSNDLTNKIGKQVESGIEGLTDDIRNAYVFINVDAQQLVSNNLQKGGLKGLNMAVIGRLAKLDRLTFCVTSTTHAELSLSVKDGQDFIESLLK